MIIKLGSVQIGDNLPTQLIAEIGQNHNGSMENAKKLIDMANNSGVKLIKFQKRDIATEFTEEAFNRPYINKNSFGKTYGEHRNFLELSKEQHRELKEYCDSLGLTYFCTPCDVPSLKIMEEIGCPFYKVASRDITNIPLLLELGKIGKPVIISTGMAGIDDIDLALESLNLPSNKVIILQCTSEYPCPNENCNLNVIKTLNEKYDNLIGYSDHTTGILAATVACTIGAKIIEKHITLARSMKGTDQAGSLEFEGLQKLNKYITNVPIMLGSYKKEVGDNILYSKNKLMKSLTTIRDLQENEIIKKEDLVLKCPGNGILWKNLKDVVGKRTTSLIKKDTTLSWNMFE